MPRDQWARANARVKYGPAPLETKKRRERKQRKPRRLAVEEIRGRFNSHSHLGFGKYATREIQNVPPDYLRWLLRTCNEPRSERMKALLRYLEEYLNQ